MTFIKKSGLPVVDSEHVPEWIRIDRLTRESACKGRFGTRYITKQYGLFDGDECIMVGSAKDIAEDLGLKPFSVRDSAENNALTLDKYRIERLT